MHTGAQGRGRLLSLWRAAGIVGTLLTCLAVAAPASAATRYAEPNGNGPEPCDLSDPCNLQTAVEGTVTDGDGVILLPGTYVETDELDDVNDAIDMHGQAGQPRPTIMSSAAAALFSNDPGTVIHHLDIEHSGSLYGLFLSAGTADEVVVHTTGVAACTAPGATGTIIRDSVCWSSAPTFGSGFFLNQSNGTATIKLRNVTAVSSAPTNSNSYGVFLGASNNANLSIDGRGVISQGVTADIRASEDTTSSSAITLDTSNYFTVSLAGTGTPTVTPAGSGTNQTAEPQFVDAATGNFHQAPGSPTIDAGGLDAFSGSIDIDGDPRTLGGAPDIGADEFVPPSEAGPGTPEAADTNPPDTTITKHPKDKTKKKTATFEFTSNEPGSSFECSLDGAAFAPCTSPDALKVKKGKHSFDVRAKDAAGNVDGSPASDTWKVKKKHK
jgi:hypothetical protein